MSNDRPLNLWDLKDIGSFDGKYDAMHGNAGKENPCDSMRANDVFYAALITMTNKGDKFRRCVPPSKVRLKSDPSMEKGNRKYYDWTDFEWDFSESKFKSGYPQHDLYSYGILCKEQRECEMIFDREIRDRARGKVHSVAEKMLKKQVNRIVEIDQLRLDAEAWFKKLNKVERRYVQKLIDLDK